MARKKVKLTWIVNDSSRKASLKKRRIGLLKKTSELTTLCGIDAFIIIYSLDDPEPTVWSSRYEVEELISRFENMSEMDGQKKITNQESYLRERMKKMHEQSKKLTKKNKEIEMSYLMHTIYEDEGFDRLDQTQVSGLTWMVLEKLNEIKRRKEYFQQMHPLQPSSSHPSGPFAPRIPNDGDHDNDDTRGEIGGEHGVENPTDGARSWDEWFADMINNPQHNVAGGSSTMADLGMSHPFSLGGDYSYGEPDVGFQHHEDPNIFRPELLHSRNIGGSTLGGTDFGMRSSPCEDSTAGGIDMMGQLSRDKGEDNTGNIFEPWLPFVFNPGGGASNTINNLHQHFPQGDDLVGNRGVNDTNQWLPFVNTTAVNQYDPWLNRGDTRRDCDNLGYGLFPDSNVDASNVEGDAFQEPSQHNGGDSRAGASHARGSDVGWSGHLGDSSTDLGLPFDATEDWPRNPFNP